MNFDPSSTFGFLDLDRIAQLLAQGGPVVFALLVLSIVTFALSLMKIVQFIGQRVGAGTGKTERALATWHNGEPDAAIAMLASSRKPSCMSLAHAMNGLRRGHSEGTVREDVERFALGALDRVNGGIRFLELTVQIAPLIGLFGTVIGMIDAFQSMQAAGSTSDPSALAGGIWVALLTTAAGLALAIPLAFVVSWLQGRVAAERRQIEQTITGLFTGNLEGGGRLSDRLARGEQNSSPTTMAAE